MPEWTSQPTGFIGLTVPSTQTLEEIRAAAEVGSPMLDNVANATPLTGVVA